MKTNEVKNDQIEFILTQGLRKPKSAKEKMSEVARSIGFRNIFWDTGYGLLLTAITLLIVSSIFIFMPEEYRFTTSTIAAPLIFLLILFLTEMSERVNGLYELKQTCHYTILQVTTLRVICYSMIGFIFTIGIVWFSTGNGYDFLLLLSICLFALSLCATLSLSFIKIFHGKWTFAMFSCIWIVLSLLIPFTLGIERWEGLLREMPITLMIILAIIGCISLAYQLKKIFSEVRNYATA